MHKWNETYLIGDKMITQNYYIQIIFIKKFRTEEKKTKSD